LNGYIFDNDKLVFWLVTAGKKSIVETGKRNNIG